MSRGQGCRVQGCPGVASRCQGALQKEELSPTQRHTSTAPTGTHLLSLVKVVCKNLFQHTDFAVDIEIPTSRCRFRCFTCWQTPSFICRSTSRWSVATLLRDSFRNKWFRVVILCSREMNEGTTPCQSHSIGSETHSSCSICASHLGVSS